MQVRIHGLRFWVQGVRTALGSGFRVRGSSHRIQNLELRFLGIGTWVVGSGLRAQGTGHKLQGLPECDCRRCRRRRGWCRVGAGGRPLARAGVATRRRHGGAGKTRCGARHRVYVKGRCAERWVTHARAGNASGRGRRTLGLGFRS